MQRGFFTFDKAEQRGHCGFQTLRAAGNQFRLWFKVRHKSVLTGQVFGAGLDDMNRRAKLVHKAAHHQRGGFIAP